MSDIFYSEVDRNLWQELNARGQSGKFNRNTADLDFMLGKVANVAIVPYNLDKNNPEIKYTIREAILGGKTVISNEYLPSGEQGFLSDRRYTVYNKLRKSDNNNEDSIPSGERLNKSRRIPPYITSMDMTIGDHSMGLLNSVTMNFTIPNPERDLNYIESVYFRPGRHVTVIIEHPESAILTKQTTNGLLSEDSLPTAEVLKKSKKNYTQSDLDRFRKLNCVVFDGVITSFTLDYQTDMTVTATLNIIGTSNVYTDVSLIINSSEKTKTDTEETDTETEIYPSFFKNLSDEVENAVTNGVWPEYKNNEKLRWELYTSPFDIFDGAPYPGMDSQRYISLAWVVDYCNRVILTKTKETIPDSMIVFTPNDFLCTSNYYSRMVSCNPMRILFGGSNGAKWRDYGNEFSNTIANPDDDPAQSNLNYNLYSDISIDALLGVDPGPDPNVFGSVFVTYNSQDGSAEGKKQSERVVNLTDNMVGSIGFNDDGTDQLVFFPTALMINMEVLQENIKSLEEQKIFTISNLLNSLSDEVYNATGHAINLKLVSHPELPEFLIWYDCNHIKSLKSTTPVKPYPIPMFANHPSGTVIRDFKFSGKLPSDASNLAYVLNSDPSEIAESDIAPFVSYMYTANTIERSAADHSETITNIISDSELVEIKQKYKEAHERYVEELALAQGALGGDFFNLEKQSALAAALQKYVQYPTPDIITTNQMIAPVIPFDVEFTIDGINGFRYGDVLTFDALPSRYKINCVFCIISVTHNVTTEGQWTTTVRCIMRPKIDS